MSATGYSHYMYVECGYYWLIWGARFCRQNQLLHVGLNFWLKMHILHIARKILEDYMKDANKMMKNFAKVTIYNERLSVTRVEEVEAYSLLQLFSDIGMQ